MKPASSCCYASVTAKGGAARCTWCGKPCDITTERDELWEALNADLCDWDRPSQLATYDLHETIAKVRRFIKSRDVENSA